MGLGDIAVAHQALDQLCGGAVLEGFGDVAAAKRVKTVSTLESHGLQISLQPAI
jgi:hypothetical protein